MPQANCPKRHHYLPRWYQVGFSERSDECLWVYDRNLQIYKCRHPKCICVENDLYTVDPSGKRVLDVETKVLSEVDGMAAAAIQHLPDCQDDAWREAIACFMAFQMLRTPTFRGMTTELYRRVAEEFLSIGFADVERSRQLMERYATETGAQLDGVTPESMVEAVATGQIEVVATETPFLYHMLGSAKWLADFFLSLKWTVVSAQEESGFITCDYPVVVLTSDPLLTGPGASGAVTLFPLSRQFCLQMAGTNGQALLRKASRAGVRSINLNLAVGSERFIMASSREQLESIVRRSGCEKQPNSPRGQVSVLDSGAEGGLIMATMWPRRSYTAIVV